MTKLIMGGRVRKNFSLFLASFLFLSNLALPGCVRKQALMPETFSNGDLGGVISHRNACEEPVYLGVRDNSGRLGQLEGLVRQKLASQGHRLTKNPSEAVWIAQVTLPAAGPCNAKALRAAVNSGYDSKCQLGQQDKNRANGCVADILLVKRNIPEDKRASHKRLRNVSARNALASSQMRLGLVLNGKKSGEHLALALASEIARALTGYSGSGPDPRAHP